MYCIEYVCNIQYIYTIYSIQYSVYNMEPYYETDTPVRIFLEISVLLPGSLRFSGLTEAGRQPVPW